MKKQFIIIGILALLVCVEFSGCTQIGDNTQTITINGMGTVETVNNLEHPIILLVNGMNCVITVSKETNLKEVQITGMNSIVRVSRSHSFTSTVNGLNAKIEYYD